MVAQLAEVLAPEAKQRCAEELGRAADEVMHLRLKLSPVAIIPRVRGDVAVLHEHRVGVPVLRLTLEPVAAFENEDVLAGRRELSCQCAAAGAATDDDDIEMFIHAYRPTLFCMMPPSVNTVVAVM